MTSATLAALGTSATAAGVIVLALIRQWTTHFNDEHGDALIAIWTLVMLGFFISFCLLELG
jgi:hypothetical protein